MNRKLAIYAFMIITSLSTATVFCFAQESLVRDETNNRIEAKVNKDFVITLGSNKTTGYEWQLADPLDKNMLQLIGSEYKRDNTNLVGAGGKEIWTFKALKAGRTTIVFKYVRPWEKDVLPVKKEIFPILIKEETKSERIYTGDYEVVNSSICPYHHVQMKEMPIVYGYPSEKLLERSKMGEVVLGGCIIDGKEYKKIYICPVDKKKFYGY